VSPIRKVTFAAIVLLAGFGAVASQAAASVFEAGNFPAAISGEQSEAHVFNFGEVKVTCSHATFAGELEAQLETLTLSPTYTECKSTTAVTVSANGCSYIFKVSKKVEENRFSGSVDVSCPIGKAMAFTSAFGLCEAQIGSQTGLAEVTYKNNTSATPKNLKVEEKLTALHYTVTKNSGGCFPGTGEKTNGTLIAISTLKASVGGEAALLIAAELGKTKLCKAAPEANDKIGRAHV